jgi:hypothetical protein
MQTVYYGISSLLLGILLFFPVRRFMLSMAINRHQRKVNREAAVEEQELLRKKVTPLAAAVAVTFAFLFQKVLLMKFFGG